MAASVASAAVSIRQGEQRFVSIAGEFFLGEGQTISIDLFGPKRVQKIYIQAEGVRSDASFEVIANGDTKGTVHVPGRDPSYIVTIADTTNTIQFRHINGGTVHVRDVRALMSDEVVAAPTTPVTTAPAPHGGTPVVGSSETYDWIRHGNNQAASLADEAIGLVNALEPYATSGEFTSYLLPIKKVAARAYARHRRNDLSERVKVRMTELKTAILNAAAYLDHAFEQDAAFDLCAASFAPRTHRRTPEY